MFLLLLLVIFGLGFSYLATQNTMGVNLQLYNQTLTGVPLYIVALGSLLVGFFIAWIVSLIDWASSAMTMHSKDSAIHRNERTIMSLQEKVRDLELENARLRGETDEEVEPEKISREEHRPAPNLFDRLRHRLSI